MQLFPAFAVPMAAAELPNSAQLNQDLARLILSRETDQFRNPNASMEQPKGLFESEFSFFSWPESPVRTLRQQIWQAIGFYISQLNGYSSTELNPIQIRSHTWFHITRRGGYFGLHNHPMASVSGVYCVASGKHDLGVPTSGLLRFHCPFNTTNMFLDPGNARLQDPYQSGNRSFDLQAGQLVLFPSWLMHEVLPFHGDGERITIAFNCWFEQEKR
jgi:uncharacterized protein (TIGR02466 family)